MFTRHTGVHHFFIHPIDCVYRTVYACCVHYDKCSSSFWAPHTDTHTHIHTHLLTSGMKGGGVLYDVDIVFDFLFFVPYTDGCYHFHVHYDSGNELASFCFGTWGSLFTFDFHLVFSTRQKAKTKTSSSTTTNDDDGSKKHLRLASLSNGFYMRVLYFGKRLPFLLSSMIWWWSLGACQLFTW